MRIFRCAKPLVSTHVGDVEAKCGLDTDPSRAVACWRGPHVVGLVLVGSAGVGQQRANGFRQLRRENKFKRANVLYQLRREDIQACK